MRPAALLAVLFVFANLSNRRNGQAPDVRHPGHQSQVAVRRVRPHTLVFAIVAVQGNPLADNITALTRTENIRRVRQAGRVVVDKTK